MMHLWAMETYVIKETQIINFERFAQQGPYRQVQTGQNLTVFKRRLFPRMHSSSWHLNLPIISEKVRVGFASVFILFIWTFDLKRFSLSPHAIFKLDSQKTL